MSVVFFESYFMDEIVKFSKNCGTFTIKESGGGESTNYGKNKKLLLEFLKISKG